MSVKPNPGPGGGALSLFDSNYGVDVDTVLIRCDKRASSKKGSRGSDPDSRSCTVQDLARTAATH